MKQNMKRAWLVLCMAVCFFTLSACAKKADVTAEPIPQDISETMIRGAENYLLEFNSYDDETIAIQLKQAERMKNSVMISALTAWKNVKEELGAMTDGPEAILSKEVTRVSEDSYRLDAKVSYEKKEMNFTLSVKEVIGNDGSGGMALMPTELIFAPDYTTGEKLAKAGKNTLMGMGTVFVVLVFISLIISSLKNVNTWEANLKAKKDAKEKEAAEAAEGAYPAAPPTSMAAPIQTAAPIPVLAAPEPVVPMDTPDWAEEDLMDDMELTAVIAAAIAAAQSVPVEGLVVRSIRRKPASKWKNA